MWSAAGFCSETSSIYSVYAPFKYSYCSTWSFISFLCSGYPPSHIRCSFCLLSEKKCIEDVAEWMGDSKSKMGDDETELMPLTRDRNEVRLSVYYFLSLFDTLVFYLDETLSMGAHNKIYTCVVFFSLGCAQQICRFSSSL